MADFSNILRSLRKQKNMSQQALADSIGISKSALNMYERGERQPNFTTLELIADYFNLSTDFILGKVDTVFCRLCSTTYNPLDVESSSKHEELHKRFYKAKEQLGFFYSASDALIERGILFDVLNAKEGVSDSSKALAVENLLKIDYCDHIRNNDYIIDISYNDYCSEKLQKRIYLDLVSKATKEILFQKYEIIDENNSFSEKEIRLINNYRRLDEHGKEAIEFLLNRELFRLSEIRNKIAHMLETDTKFSNNASKDIYNTNLLNVSQADDYENRPEILKEAMKNISDD